MSPTSQTKDEGGTPSEAKSPHARSATSGVTALAERKGMLFNRMTGLGLLTKAPWSPFDIAARQVVSPRP